MQGVAVGGDAAVGEGADRVAINAHAPGAVGKDVLGLAEIMPLHRPVQLRAESGVQGGGVVIRFDNGQAPQPGEKAFRRAFFNQQAAAPIGDEAYGHIEDAVADSFGFNGQGFGAAGRQCPAMIAPGAEQAGRGIWRAHQRAELHQGFIKVAGGFFGH